MSSSSFLSEGCPKFCAGLRQLWGTRPVIVFERKGSTSHSLWICLIRDVPDPVMIGPSTMQESHRYFMLRQRGDDRLRKWRWIRIWIWFQIWITKIRLSNTVILFLVSYQIVSSDIEKSVTRLVVTTSNIKFNDYKKFDIMFLRVKNYFGHFSWLRSVILSKWKKSIDSFEADREKSFTSSDSNFKDGRSFWNDSSEHRNIIQSSFYKDLKEIFVVWTSDFCRNILKNLQYQFFGRVDLQTTDSLHSFFLQL